MAFAEEIAALALEHSASRNVGAYYGSAAHLAPGAGVIFSGVVYASYDPTSKRFEARRGSILILTHECDIDPARFLSKRYPELERIGARCERFFSDDPVFSLIAVRRFTPLSFHAHLAVHPRKLNRVCSVSGALARHDPSSLQQLARSETGAV
jgi:hypothetical protein